MSRVSKLESDLAFAIKAVGLPEPVREYQFAPPRKWRADFAWPERRLLVECDGGTFTGGRHVRGLGFERDAEKSNAANLAGWRVLHFNQRQITSGEALNQIERALKEAA